MMGWSCRPPMRSAAPIVDMDVIHFPEDSRPAHWRRPVVALGNFDGLHRGHLKDSRSRASSGPRARRDADRDDLRSASAARRAPRQGAAAADDQGPEDRGDAGARGSKGWRSSGSRRSCRGGSRSSSCATVLVEWLHVAEVWVGGNFLFGRERSGNFSLLRSLGARYGFRVEKIDPVRYKRLRGQQHARAAAGVRGARRRSGRADGALSTSSTARSSTATSAAGRSGFRPRTSRRRTSCFRRTASMRRR